MKTTTNTLRTLVKMILATVLLLGAAVTSSASSTTIASYDAGTNGVPAVAPDPASVEGGSWEFFDLTSGSTNFIGAGQSPDPLHANLNAWRILDNQTTSGFLIYKTYPTDEQLTNAAWCGWKASSYQRVENPADPVDAGFSTFFKFGNQSVLNRHYIVYAKVNEDGLNVWPATGSVILTSITNTTDALAYHLYEIIYDNATRTAALLVDGQVISTNWPTISAGVGLNEYAWGNGSSTGRGDMYLNQVKLEVTDPSPTTVTLNPASVAKDVTESATFTADFSGCATNLQWYKDGSPIPGANGRSYTIANIVTPDGGQYKMGISDPQTGTEVFTTEATLTINPDSILPTVVSVQGLISLRDIRVKFSEGIDPTTAQNPANYQVAGGALTVSSATVEDLTTVVVQTSDQIANTSYDLILSGIEDQSGNSILTVTQAFTSVNMVSVSSYDAGTENNPTLAPDPESTSAGRWTLVRGTNELLSTTGVSPDPGTGLNAWNITDNTTQSGQNIWHQMSYPKESHNFARTNGWRIRVRARFVDDFGGSMACLMMYGDGSGRLYYIFFDVSGIDLDLKAALSSGPTVTLTTGGVGAFDYHTHDIVFDPETQRASYYFDGTLMASGWNGANPAAIFNGPVFGASSSGGMGSMNYNQVEFTVNNATAPVIVTNPASANVTAGASVTFNGYASGFVGGYQWYKDGTRIANATGNSYTIASATALDAGDYTLRAFTSSVEVESTAATLAVVTLPLLSINSSAGNITVTFTGTLQSATNVSGIFTDVDPQPTSPFILTNPSGDSLFLRSRN